MSLQFILGNSGAGKTEYLYQYVIRESMANPQFNYLVLVPEQFTMQTQRDLCLLHPRGGIMNIDVLSFGRLAYRIFEETGRQQKQVLDDEGKNLILRKLAVDMEDELKVLGGNLKKQGYISEVKSVISEFTQYGVDMVVLDELMESLEPDSYLYYKLQDIRKIYAGFEDYLANHYITKEEILDVLREIAPSSALLKESVIVLDGFTGFTPIQNRLLGELMKLCQRILITVVIDENEDVYRYPHPYQLFALSKQMVSSLLEIAKEQNVEIGEMIKLFPKQLPRFRQEKNVDNEQILSKVANKSVPEKVEYNKASREVAQAGLYAVYQNELGFLEANIFRNTKTRYSQELSGISLHAARNPRDEAEFVAGQIRKLVRGGMRYRDIAVIAGEMSGYTMHLEKAFESYEIPYFMDHKKSILLNAFVDYLRSLLEMISAGYSYISVFRWLRTGFSGFSQSQIDLLDNYVRAAGIRGFKNWQKEWDRNTRQGKKEDLPFLNQLRLEFVGKLTGITQVLTKPRKTVKEITVAVYEFLGQEELQQQLIRWEETFHSKNMFALAKEYAQVYGVVLALFDKFVELLGDTKIVLKEYCEMLDVGLEEAKIGVIPPGPDQVMVGDVTRTRIKNIKALFFVGANDCFLPGKLGSDGLLSGRDRERFSQKQIALSPGAKEQTYIQQFYLYMNLTKPSKRLYVSYSKVSTDGKSLRPAYLVKELRKLFPKLTVQDEEQGLLVNQEFTKKQLKYHLAEGLTNRQYGLTEEWKELYRWAKEKEQVGDILAAAFFRKDVEKIGEQQASQLYSAQERISVSRLERFTTCAYAHFLSYGLRLREREEYAFEALDLGNVAHKALELFSNYLAEQDLQWRDLTEEDKVELVEESVKQSIHQYDHTVLSSTARNAYMVHRIHRLIARSVWALSAQMANSDFTPMAYEWDFSRGVIDRVDTCLSDDRIYVTVTDYKTGTMRFDLVSFYHGLQLQLPVYLRAAMAEIGTKYPDKKVIPAGMFYYQIKDPLIQIKEGLREEDMTISLLKELKLDGMIHKDEQVIERLERGLEGTSLLFPMGKKKDGELTANTRGLTQEEFRLLLEYTAKKEEQIKVEMYTGEVRPRPYLLGNKTGCDYCDYKTVCGFDLRLGGYEYRKLDKLAPQKEQFPAEVGARGKDDKESVQEEVFCRIKEELAADSRCNEIR